MPNVATADLPGLAERARADEDSDESYWRGVAAALAEDLLAVRAVVAHMARQVGDDRCWLDQDALYDACGVPRPDRRVGDKFAMLKNCVRFVEHACEGGGPWKTYEELLAENAKLREANLALTERVRVRAEIPGKAAEKTSPA